MQINIDQKHFLVTGGSRGIGRSIVLKLTNAGATVSFTYNSNQTEAAKVLAMVAQQGKGKAYCYQLDTTDKKKLAEQIEQIESKGGPIDGLVNNAGIIKDSPFFKMSDEDWEDVINTNLNGSFYMTKAIIGKLIRRDGGKIVNMASVSGMRGSKGQANYGATKAALISFTKSIALEFAKFNVQVNAIAPGFIHTEMTESMDADVVKKMVSMIPTKRMGTTDEVADLTLFLMSPYSDYITGQTVVIDGGLTA